MEIGTACEALRARRRIQVSYDGFHRVVEVHSWGFATDGRAIMRVWQVRGGSVSDAATGWKLLRLADTRCLDILDEPSAALREGFRRRDPDIARVIREAEAAREARSAK